MKIDFEKIGIIASYLSENTKKLYVTKLFKLLYYIDFIAYAKRGASVTGDVYYKLPYGPVPTCTKNEIDLMSVGSVMEKNIKSQLAKYIELQDDEDRFGKLVVAKSTHENIAKNMDKSLSVFEVELVREVAKKFEKAGAKELSEKTHKEKPWLLSSSNARIDYSLASQLDTYALLPAFAGK